MKIDIVIDLGFGDSGKGNVVNALSTEESLVVRFNGGHQAGHTVVEGDKRHIFASFGSGTLKGASTYISEYCTIYPPALDREQKVLGFYPKLYIDNNAMLTTPYDIEYNKILDTQTNHGSVGVGFGTTIARHEAGYKLYARDMLNMDVLVTKLKLIDQYYSDILSVSDESIDDWLLSTIDIIEHYDFVNAITDIPLYWRHIIFEGAQGIMLDMDYGFFPHVTRSNTTSKNAMEILNKDLNLKDFNIYIYYVTRAYQTRHGNGPMIGKPLSIEYIKDNPDETNVTNYQGVFRKDVLNLDLLKYAIDCDKQFHINISTHSIFLVITCLDQVCNGDGTTYVLHNGEVINKTTAEIGSLLGFRRAIDCYTPNLIIEHG
jgi:adenylosuccinate synthase